VLEPGEPYDHRAEEEAAMDVSPDDRHEWDEPQHSWMLPTDRQDHQRDAEQCHAEELWSQGERDGADHERSEGQPRGAAKVEAAAPARLEQAAERHAHQRRAQDREASPTGDPE